MQRTIRSFIYGCTIFGALGPLPSLGTEALSTNNTPNPVDIRRQESLIDKLNNRYKSRVANCGSGISAMDCSGIILRRAKLEDGVEFWKLKKAATDLGSVTFSWLRADGNNYGDKLFSGFIYMDKDTAAKTAEYNLKKLEPHCIYPFMAETQGNPDNPDNLPGPRELAGCAPAKTQVKKQNGKSYCKTVKATTLNSWMAYFENTGKSKLEKQCSLSAMSPGQLLTSLEVRKKYDNEAKKHANELLMPLWTENQAKQLPIEAFFFNTVRSGSFDHTLKLRDAFYNKTGRMVPLVGLNISGNNESIFKPLTRDQQGRATANALNLRYAKTDMNCDGRVSLYCNGVLVRTMKFETTARAWNPTQNSRNIGAVAFSYLRADQGIRKLAWEHRQGLIFSELDALKQPRMYPIMARCMYPSDAGSDVRGSNGCGAHRSYPNVSKECSAIIIVEKQNYIDHYRTVPDIKAGDAYFTRRNQHQCSLAINPKEFNIALSTREQLLTRLQRSHHNELIVAPWPQDIPDLLPLEAFFYQDTADNKALTHAKEMQKDLHARANKLWKPVIRLNLNAPSGGAFATYRAQDQN
ncbi:TPA: hypothetical protein ACKP22_002198 [Pseudomonas putida]